MKKVFIWLMFIVPLMMSGQNFIVPIRYDFQKTDNQFLLSTLTKMLLEKEGFKVFYDNSIPKEVSVTPCKNLKVKVLNSSGMFTTKLQIILVDCFNNEVFKSEVGTSREKEFKVAYQNALKDAFAKSNFVDFKTTRNEFSSNIQTINQSSNSKSVLYAQPTETGFKLIDDKSKIVLILTKTSLPDVFNAEDSDGNNGLFYHKEGQYIFEYLKDNILQKDTIDVKF